MIWLIVLIIYVLVGHFLADFVMQTTNMSMNKSHSNKWLTIHVLVYGLTLSVFAFPFILIGLLVSPLFLVHVLGYIILNMALHWVTDYFTSRATSKLYEQKKIREFFIVIGLDQLIHAICLLSTLSIFL